MSITKRDEAELGIQKNYLINGGGESGTTEWFPFNTTFTEGIPGTITPGSSFVSLSAVTTDILNGNASLQFSVTTAVGSTGSGVITTPLTFQDADLGKVIAAMFDYNFVTTPENVDVSGSSTQTIEVWIYNVGLGTWYQPAGYRSINTKGMTGSLVPGKTPAITFQSDISNASNKNQYQLAFIIQADPVGTFSMNFDNVTLGQQTKAFGPAVSDWVSFDLIVDAVTTPPTKASSPDLDHAIWRRVGDSMEIHWDYFSASNSGASDGSGFYLFSLPAGYSIDSSKVTTNSSFATTSGLGVVGVANFNNQSVDVDGIVIIYDPTHFILFLGNDTTGNTFVSSSFGNLNQTNSAYSFTAIVPIAGWSSNCQLSQDTDTRVISGNFTNTAGTTITDGVDFPVPFPTTNWDTAASFNTTQYTAPVSGYYRVVSQITFTAFNVASANLILKIRKNGTTPIATSAILTQGVSYAWVLSVADTVLLNAGDSIEIVTNIGTGSNQTLNTTATTNYLSVDRISGPSVIAATETVSVSAENSSGPTIPSGTFTQVGNWTTIFDDHASFNASTGTYTIPVSGLYEIILSFQYATVGGIGQTFAQIYKNGVPGHYHLETGPTDFETLYTSWLMQCVAGDLITFFTAQNSGLSRTFNADGNGNYISIVRQGN